MRKKYSAEEKVKILKEHLTENITISDISRKYKIHPNQIHKWKKDLFEGALDTFSGKHKKSRKTTAADRHEEELKKKDGIISFLAEENLKLKKKYFGDL
jgi:transposase-like protein